MAGTERDLEIQEEYSLDQIDEHFNDEHFTVGRMRKGIVVDNKLVVRLVNKLGERNYRFHLEFYHLNNGEIGQPFEEIISYRENYRYTDHSSGVSILLGTYRRKRKSKGGDIRFKFKSPKKVYNKPEELGITFPEPQF